MGGGRRLTTAGNDLSPQRNNIRSCEWVTRGGTWAATGGYFIDFPSCAEGLHLSGPGDDIPGPGVGRRFFPPTTGVLRGLKHRVISRYPSPRNGSVPRKCELSEFTGVLHLLFWEACALLVNRNS